MSQEWVSSFFGNGQLSFSIFTFCLQVVFRLMSGFWDSSRKTVEILLVLLWDNVDFVLHNYTHTSKYYFVR